METDAQRAALDLILTGRAQSRADLARIMNVSPSTAAIWVNNLLEASLISEDGEGPSRGGRRPRRLRAATNIGHIQAAELGGNSAHLGLCSLSGELLVSKKYALSIADGPQECLSAVTGWLRDLAAEHPEFGEPRAVGVSLPGPVDPETGTVNLPSRMPGWAGIPIKDMMTKLAGVPAAVDNDANLMALGEHRYQLGSGGHSVTIKAGTAVGAGIVVNGELYRGATNASGDITHTSIQAGGERPCSCGKIGCLETIASGAGIVSLLNEQGFKVETIADALQLARNADPIATTLIRSAGGHLGEVLGRAISFFNPDAVFLTGGLASSEHFVSAVKARIFADCHPLATQSLRIEAAQLGELSGLVGAAIAARSAVSIAPTYGG